MLLICTLSSDSDASSAEKIFTPSAGVPACHLSHEAREWNMAGYTARAFAGIVRWPLDRMWRCVRDLVKTLERRIFCHQTEFMKEELTQFFWIPFSPWPMVFVLAMIGLMVATLIAFAVGNEHRRKIALLIPVVIVVGLFATHAMKVLAGGRAARLTTVLELPDTELKIEPVTIQSVRFP